MNVYTVHLKGSLDDEAALENAVFVREGFTWPALFFGPLWLLWNRLWVALLTCVLVEMGIVFLGPSILSKNAVLCLLLLVNVALGFEGAQIRRGSLQRRGFRLVDIVHGLKMIDAERVFFGRVGGFQPEHSVAVQNGFSRQPGMVGLFPSVGG